MLERLPFVAKVYTSVRQLLDTMMAKKEASQRVVLIDFPIQGQKSIGFLTRTLTDSTTGQELAAVLLPNAINPTSAFLQLLPLERVTETDLTMEQAMSMLMTGGAVAPDTIRFAHIAEFASPIESPRPQRRAGDYSVACTPSTPSPACPLSKVTLRRKTHARTAPTPAQWE